jgi:8-oxo-dGTP pyrophosphatase MutT (NUDIX family)
MNLKSWLIRKFWRIGMKPYARFTRGMTLGARVIVIDKSDRVLLVKQTYAKGWILPGGGVERGETLDFAALRELREEAGIQATGQLQLLGIYSNHRVFPGDHVACFTLREFEQLPWQPDAEIEGAAFFELHALPNEINEGSRLRIAEALQNANPTLYWS